MKILSINDTRALDEYTIKHEPISSVDLMERASLAFCDWFIANVFTKSVTVISGTGNNGGDGLAIARILKLKAYDVSVYVVGDAEKGSNDFKLNWERMDIKPQVLKDNLPDIDPGSVIIDAMFGSGLSRPVADHYAEVIRYVNAQDNTVISVDIPSGLFADQASAGEAIIKANATVTFQLPKLAFMFPENHQFVGEWEAVDIGLSQQFIESTATNFYYLESNDIQPLIQPLAKFSHKGSNGHGLLIVGSYGKMGAAVLSAKAALRTGIGLLTVHVPRSGNEILQSTVPEAMSIPDVNDGHISEMPEVEKYSAIGIGPGLGRHVSTVKALGELLRTVSKPLVIDADALNIISENQELLELVPENSILTPHPKEFERLVGSWSDDFDKLNKLLQLAKRFNLIVILKGAHTAIASADGVVYFNSTGNPGMGKGGSGDVLLGMLTSLVAQGYQPLDAAKIGVYLHGLAGDIAADAYHERGMIASDIIDMIPSAYQELTS
ncbi:NAD(P)H-hydrate dehydratase [Fulvivirga sp.]|uniref:NAD(P)H-hydrate dehydratase n=1 Tax=Fulvivirga sp. TaxID=1931237 RepID=UPI0032ED037E